MFFDYLVDFFCVYKQKFKFFFMVNVIMFYDDVNRIGYVDDDLKRIL